MVGGDAVEHTNNWAVLVCTSTFWFNYRHVANVLSVYHIIRRLGISDDHIILMLADDMACNARNERPAMVFNHYNHHLNVYGEHVEVDYRGSEVTVDNLIRLLTNRLPEGTPQSKRLRTDERSNILIYMTGHGGDNFLKFQDTEEINAHDLADALQQMHERKRYNEILLMIDTCQASTMNEHITAPKVTAIASSIRGESSYSYHVDEELGVAVLDRFTWALLEFTKSLSSTSSATIADLFASLDPHFLSSHPDMRQSEGATPPERLRVVDFLGNVRSLELEVQPIHLQGPPRGPPSIRLTSRFAIDVAQVTRPEGSFWVHPERLPTTLRAQPSQTVVVDGAGICTMLLLAYLLTRPLVDSVAAWRRTKSHCE